MGRALPPPGLARLLLLIAAEEEKAEYTDQRNPVDLMFLAVVKRMQNDNKQGGNDESDARGNLLLAETSHESLLRACAPYPCMRRLA